MKEVGIKILKDQLSRYIRLVQQGETILILDRNEVVAEIKQPGENDRKNSKIENYIEELTKPFSLCSFDKNMRSIAKKLKMVVSPVNVIEI